MLAKPVLGVSLRAGARPVPKAMQPRVVVAGAAARKVRLSSCSGSAQGESGRQAFRAPRFITAFVLPPP